MSIIGKGYTAFQQTTLTYPVFFDPAIIDKDNKRATDPNVLYHRQLSRWWRATRSLPRSASIRPTSRQWPRSARSSRRVRAACLRQIVFADPSVIGTTRDVSILAAGDIDSAYKGQIDLGVDQSRRKVDDRQVAWIDQMRSSGMIAGAFNWGLLTFGASSRPETSGLGVALIGSLYMMLIVLVCALPVGVAASIYLEEFAKKNRFTDLIEVNINNLAAVPSIVFGLLGLAVFINFFGLPRSAPVVGGLVLSLMTLPTIIIATRAALRSVPPSIRTAALGVGASKMQMVFHHVLPLATPGILTGTIIGLARALGETAPLLLIGMVAFVADYPRRPSRRPPPCRSRSTCGPMKPNVHSSSAHRAPSSSFSSSSH